MKISIKIVVLAVIIKILLFSIIPIIVPRVLPFTGTFAYPEKIDSYNVPHPLAVLANFDGLHYLLIAGHGYTQYQQAFFPLFPLLIRIISEFTGGNYFVAGFTISIASFILGLILLKQIIKKVLPSVNYRTLLMFILVFPTSFFFNSVYTESLFFLLVVSCIYFLQRKELLYASCIAALASATRLVGIFLLAPIIATMYLGFSLRKKQYMAVFLLIPFVGLMSYMIYLQRTTGDPLFFINAQPAFGAQRSSHVILLPQVYFRYFKIFFLARIDFKYFIALLEFIMFNLVSILTLLELRLQWKRKDYLWVGVGIFSLLNLLLPTLTGTFSSIPRYSLLSLSAFIYLALIRNLRWQFFLMAIFLVLQIVLFAFFTQGYFVS